MFLYKEFLFLLLIPVGLLQFTLSPKKQVFEEIPSSYSGIHFKNQVDIDVHSVPLLKDGYVYRYNSSGVGVGDFNNDGLADLFFSGNTVDNALYLNQGNFVFLDVSDSASIRGNHTWGTGVSVVDINGDGLLDVYVCHSGNYKNADSLKNELFINIGSVNGIPHFKESAAQYGLDLPGTHTTQVVFFDYDHDGDLDAFVLNHGIEPFNILRSAASCRQKFEAVNSDMLLQNNEGYFTDVSRKAGIVGSSLNFGLGVVVTDINNDGWPDIYCSNDYSENDFLYINQKNGTFIESGSKSFTHFSNFSMGTDASDFNNDGRVDLITVDMKPYNHYRQKISIMSDNEDNFSRNLSLGFQVQYTRNMLQLNSGNDQQGLPHFTEIGQMAGIAETDWSWSGLFADFDNDGWKDLFVSSGYADDMSLDRSNHFLQSSQSEKNTAGMGADSSGILKSNSFFFKNNTRGGFTDVTNQWKPEIFCMSYAAVYADFDNDGKLDMVIGNLNDEPVILRNRQENEHANYLSVSLKQEGTNRFALGTKVKIKTGNIEQMQELQPVRGYQSSQDYVLHFGLGQAPEADLYITWPDGSVTEQKNVKANQQVLVEKKIVTVPKIESTPTKFSFTEISLTNKDSFISRQFDHPDFKYQFSLPYKTGDYGQVVTAGDIDGDGFTDYYIGGEAGAEKFFMMGQADGGFGKYNPGCFDVADDNTSALLLDIDKDGDMDLLIESRKGRTKQPQLYYTDTLYQFRVFENMGHGKFLERNEVFPELFPFKTIAAGDIDNDGDPDLFLGGYPMMKGFGKPIKSYVFRNDSKAGKIVFTDITSNVLPNAYLGMVTSAQWKDMNNDHYPELLVTGEWMSCRFFNNQKGKLTDESIKTGIAGYTGLFTSIYPFDVNGDGYTDLVVGNIGKNNSFHISKEYPAKLNMLDFENNPNKAHSAIPMVSAYYADSHEYLNLYRDELLSVSQSLRPIFNTYGSYAKTDLPELVNKTAATIDTVFTCNTDESGVFLNDGKNHFNFMPFPQFAQVSRVNAITAFATGKSVPDLLLAGNYFGYRVQYGRQDALPVVQLINKGDTFEALTPGNTGLFSTGQVSQIYTYSFKNRKRILLFKKNEAPQIFEYNQ